MNKHGGARPGAGGPEGQRPGTACKVLQIRVTAHERQVFKERATAAGLTVSEYVKMMCISGK
jgi:hypothetical protein